MKVPDALATKGRWFKIEWDGCTINMHVGEWMFYMDWRCWRFGRKIVCTLSGLRMFRRWQLGPLQVWRWFPIPWTDDDGRTGKRCRSCDYE